MTLLLLLYVLSWKATDWYIECGSNCKVILTLKGNAQFVEMIAP
jgi:hypothetical protein